MYDVVIVGAGPAGSTCARACALSGLKTALIDKSSFPRAKPCAGAVTERALSFLDFPIPQEIIESACFEARIHYGRRTVAVRRKERICILVDREQFDSLLLAKAIEAGVRFFPNERALDLDIGSRSVKLRTDRATHEAAYVIGTDGVTSVVARSVRPQLGKQETAVAIVGRVPSQQEALGEKEHDHGGLLELYFGTAPQGYGWVFQRRGYSSVGMMGLASQFSRVNEALARFAGNIGMQPADVRGHVIPLGGLVRKVHANRVLLAGDAAGFADPFHGEGITYAILSGKLAAQAMADVLRGTGQAEAFTRYARECEQRIGKNLRVALWMARLLDRYPDLFIRIFFDNPQALDRYLDISSNKLEYVQFWKWLALRIPWYLFSSVRKNRAQDNAGQAVPWTKGT